MPSGSNRSADLKAAPDHVALFTHALSMPTLFDAIRRRDRVVAEFFPSACRIAVASGAPIAGGPF
jgi:hypothetical protein